MCVRFFECYASCWYSTSWQCHDSTCVTEYLSVTLSAGGTASHRNVTTQLFPVPPTNDGALVPDVNNIVEVEGLLFEKCH